MKFKATPQLLTINKTIRPVHVTKKHHEETPFVKRLASDDKKTRDRTVQSVIKVLHRTESIPYDDTLKLWKGLFFCVWHSDKPRVQQQLCTLLAQTVYGKLQLGKSFDFLRAFYETMAREWPTIDRFRLDKFYLLLRLYFHESLLVCKRNGWRREDVVVWKELMMELPLNIEDNTVFGIKSHVIDVYIQEMDKAMGRDDWRQLGENGVELFMPVIQVLTKSRDALKLRTRVVERVLDPLLASDRGYPMAALGKALFDAGADEETSPAARAVLYAKSQEFRARSEEVEDEWQSESSDSPDTMVKKRVSWGLNDIKIKSKPHHYY